MDPARELVRVNPETSTGTAHDERSRSDENAANHPLPPGPDGYPIVGNAHQFLRDPFGFYDTLAEYGDVVQWGIPGKTFTTLLHPGHIEQVLVEDHDRFDRNVMEDFGFDFAPEGVFLTDGTQWRQQRQLMQPAFSIDRIRSYADEMVGHTRRTGEHWSDGQEIALNRKFSDLSLGILSKTLFGVEVDHTDDNEAITRAARAISDRVDVKKLSSYLPTWIPTRSNRRYERAMAEYRSRVDELIDQRRTESRDADDLLSILLYAEGPDGYTLSEAEVRDNLLTFMFAGHETTSLGLTYTFMLLAKHDDVRKRLSEEHERVLEGETPAFEHVPQLSYTEKVIKEAMRLHPPAHVLSRRATADAVVGGYRIPEGTILTLPQFWLHRDGRFWDTPDEFRPGRWTDSGEEREMPYTAEPEREDGSNQRSERPEYAYFPFGGGPRHCIGMRFAMLEMKLVVATLAQTFDVELLSDPEPEISTGGSHQPKEDVRVRVHRR